MDGIITQRTGPGVVPFGGMNVQAPWASGVAKFTLTATTTAPGATVTIHRITPTGDSITIDWGDSSSTVVGNGVTASQAHVYASADTYSISVTDAALITQLELRDSKLSGFDSSELSDNVLTYFIVYSLGSAVASTVSSADMVNWNPWNFRLSGMPAGTYVFNLANITSWSPTIFLMYSMPAGTYTVDLSDISAWRPTIFRLYSMPVSTTFTIAAVDLNGWTTTTSYRLSNNALPQADVDAILQGFYGGFAARVASGGTIRVDGTNAAPSGVLGPACPPTTGKEWAFELVNDSCGISANHWATVTTS
ncbi:MAG: hypothetical protein GY832_03765 [Chloroflexi bacterium]|nr:hypothetical protein [Chloroflexota bacterium]